MGRRVIEGVNDIGTTHRHTLIYFANVKDAYSNTYGSGKRVMFKCPDCGSIKSYVIQDFIRYGFSCPKCSDGISYPNKFIYSMLCQLNISVDTEKMFDWGKLSRYDFYIDDLKLIVEAHGLQHYQNTSGYFANRLDDNMKNDRKKKEMALKNGIEKYIEIDCRVSDDEHIRRSVMNSDLPHILNFTDDDVDWKGCHTYALKNRIKEVCDLYYQDHSIQDIMHTTNLSESSVRKYLIRGNDIGWCKYEIAKPQKVQVFKNGLIVGVYDMCKTLCENSIKDFGVVFTESKVRSVCRGERIYHKGYSFKYI